MPMVSQLPEDAVARWREILSDELDALLADEVQALVTADMEGEASNFRLQLPAPLDRRIAARKTMPCWV